MKTPEEIRALNNRVLPLINALSRILSEHCTSMEADINNWNELISASNEETIFGLQSEFEILHKALESLTDKTFRIWNELSKAKGFRIYKRSLNKVEIIATPDIEQMSEEEKIKLKEALIARLKALG